VLESNNEIHLSFKLLTKGQQWILIKSKFKMNVENNMRNNSIIALNRVVCLNEFLNKSADSNLNQLNENENKKRKFDDEKNCKFFIY
jgi:hypothetical protein